MDGGNSEAVSDDYYIPFDPEARLNTEANNRKHSGLNGFTQTYLKDWAEGGSEFLTLSLGGYLFKIKLDSCYQTPKEFGSKLATITGSTDKIYANIRIEDVHLFSGFEEYYTGILRNQSNTDVPELSLDLLKYIDEPSISDLQNSSNYYFSGLSFSASPITRRDGETRSESAFVTSNGINQYTISLCILQKNGEEWQVHEPAYLPNIEHGDTKDSVKLNNVTLNKIDANELTHKGNPLSMLTVAPSGSKWQLQFSSAKNN